MPGNPGHRCMQWTNGDAAMPGNPGHAADTRLRRKNANYIILYYIILYIILYTHLPRAIKIHCEVVKESGSGDTEDPAC